MDMMEELTVFLKHSYATSLFCLFTTCATLSICIAAGRPKFAELGDCVAQQAICPLLKIWALRCAFT